MHSSKLVHDAASIATFPWVRNLIDRYKTGDLVGIQDFPHVTRALAALVARPAVVKGLGIPNRSRFDSFPRRCNGG